MGDWIQMADIYCINSKYECDWSVENARREKM